MRWVVTAFYAHTFTHSHTQKNELRTGTKKKQPKLKREKSTTAHQFLVSFLNTLAYTPHIAVGRCLALLRRLLLIESR